MAKSAQILALMSAQILRARMGPQKVWS